MKTNQIKMKKLFILPLLFIGAVSMSANAQSEAAKSVNAQTEVVKETGSRIEFSKEVHDYGKIKHAGDP